MLNHSIRRMALGATRRTARQFGAVIVVGLLLVGCKPPNPPGPTPIPSPSITLTLPPSPTLAFTVTPIPPLIPMITSSPLPQPTQVAQIPTQSTATPGPYCYKVKKGDTLAGLIFRAGYANLDVIDEVRTLNGIDGNNIAEGGSVCVPRQTATPTPTGYELTLTKQHEIFGGQADIGPMALATYVIQKGDDISGLQLKLGLTLRQICELNNPDPINCAGCDLDAKLMQQHCRPLIVEGKVMHIPGPTPTPTITATFTGSETPTATPSYDAPQLIAPVMDAKVGSPLEFNWLPTNGLLKPDEFYLVIWTDMTTKQTQQDATAATSFRVPAELQPTDGTPHRVNWQVGVARQVENSYVLLGPLSNINSFDWQSR